MSPALLGMAVGATLPMLLLAWLPRLAARSRLTPKSAAWSSVIAWAAYIGIASFGAGQGSFAARVANIPDYYVVTAATIAAVFVSLILVIASSSTPPPSDPG